MCGRRGSHLQILQSCIIQVYENVNLFTKVWFSLMNQIIKSKESSHAHFSSLSWFHFLHFLQYGAISHFFIIRNICMKETYSHISYPFAKLDIIIYNYIKFNKWVTDMGICFFQKHSIKIIRLRKEIILGLSH